MAEATLDTLVDRIANGDSQPSWGRAVRAGLTLGILGNLFAGPIIAEDITHLLQYVGDPAWIEHYRAMLAATRDSTWAARGISFVTVGPAVLLATTARHAYQRVRTYFDRKSPAERIYDARGNVAFVYSLGQMVPQVGEIVERRKAFSRKQKVTWPDALQMAHQFNHSFYDTSVNIFARIIARAKDHDTQKVKLALNQYIRQKRAELRPSCRNGGRHEFGHNVNFLVHLTHYALRGDVITLDDRNTTSPTVAISALSAYSAWQVGTSVYDRTSSFILAAAATVASYLPLRSLAIYAYSSAREQVSHTLTKVKNNQREEYARFERLLERL